MVNSKKLSDMIMRRVNRVLTAAEIGLNPVNFSAFRKITLDEFGEQGLMKELRELENKR